FTLGEGIYMLPSDLQLKVGVKRGFSDKLKVGTQGAQAVKEHKLHTLTLHEQRISKEHQDELNSLVLCGSLAVVGLVYFLKTR
ncbi:hypothetical protein, partial [Acinetobacter baumannii]|uniref:hypothetical protein n=1 Tax=Acinetobacter baumannii TaxID=470 RepID=UPI001C0669C3